MQNLVITGLDPVIQSLVQVVKNWIPRSSRGMTWVGSGAIRYQSRNWPPSSILRQNALPVDLAWKRAESGTQNAIQRQ